MQKHLFTILAILSGMIPACNQDSEAICGNNLHEKGEACDDGNKLSGDGCNSSCQIENGYICVKQSAGFDICKTICGDNIVSGTEECDDGNDNDCDGCLSNCKKHENICGDGIICETEQCDDGNDDYCDGCFECQQVEPHCGDGHICPGEICDDGNYIDDDDCSNSCLENQKKCGDGVKWGNEQCDDGNNDPCDGCDENCQIYKGTCNDGILCGTENCDDPDNTLNGNCSIYSCLLNGNYNNSTPDILANRRVKLVWSDEFNGPVAGREHCYDTANETCMTLYWEAKKCPSSFPATEQQLSALNIDSLPVDLSGLDKCTWDVFSMYNWMDRGKKFGQGVNAFHPSMVKVKDGALVLTAKAIPPKAGWGNLNKDSNIIDIMAAYDCGNKEGAYGNTTECPFISGGLWSKKFLERTPGYQATFGHWEVRAKLPIGDGSWPAHWLLPQEGPWPTAGEIDILETTYDKDPAVYANYHAGDTITDKDNNIITTHTSLNGSKHGHTLSYKRQNEEFHIYSVDWTPDYLHFYVDQIQIANVDNREYVRTSNNDTGERLSNSPNRIATAPFHWILNSTIAAFSDKYYPNPLNFDESKQVHIIDYVRHWQDCSTDVAELCPYGGTYTQGACLVNNSIDQLFIINDQIFYKASDSQCPQGGNLQNDRCVILTGEPGHHVKLINGAAYYDSPCQESTLSESCVNPCEGIGQYQNGKCVIFTAPFATIPSIMNKHGYYNYIKKPNVKICPYGKDNGTLCDIGLLPPDKNYFVFEQSIVFLPSCIPEDTMANCTYPCPAGGLFDGINCFYGEPPAGTTAAINESHFVYTLPENSTTCPYGNFDTSLGICIAEKIPDGAKGQINNNKFYLEAACQKVPTI